MKKYCFLLLFFCNITFAQNNTIHTIYTGADGIQTSMHFENIGSLFQLTDKENYRIQKDENGALKSNLCVSGDFDGDGVLESALFYDYTYFPNGKPRYTGSKIVLYSERNQSIVPTDVWFSKLKTDFNFDEFTFASAGDFNGDGKSDIALLKYVENLDNQTIYVLLSNGKAFEEPTVFYITEKEEFNFHAVKFVVSGDFAGDKKTDLAVFYDYFGDSDDTKQKIFIFEATETAFKEPFAIFSDTKANFNFDYGKGLLAGDFNGDGQEDIACLINDEINDKQAIEIFENQNKNGFNKITYLSPDRNDFNFSHVKLAASGQINADNKTDIVLCYDHVGFGSQIMFVFESTGTSFAAYKNYFSAPKAAFSFDNVNALFVGKYDAKPKVMPTIWYNNKPGAVTFGFDDGMTNSLRYGANELTKNKLKGTFYIISNIPFNNEADYCNWDTLRHYKNLGHEMGSHTANHKFSGNYTGVDSLKLLNSLLLKSKTDLDTQLDQNTLSFSYPFGSFNQQTPIEVAKYFQNARSSQSGYNLPTPFDFHALKSLYIASTTSNETIKSWLDTAVTYNYHVSLMYHNIQNKPFDKLADEYSFALSDLKQNIKDAIEADLWIDTQANIYKYTRERNASKLLSYEVYDDSVCFVVDDFLDNNTFNQPLTLKVELPTKLCYDSVYTNISNKRLAIVTENNRNYCLINTIPDNSRICISKSKILSAIANVKYKNSDNIKCYRADNMTVKIDNLDVSNDALYLKVYNTNGVILFEKNVGYACSSQLNMPFSQQLKYLVLIDKWNRIVTKQIIF